MTDVLRAMISSTSRDLPKHREQARDACLRQEFLPLMMEHLPPSPDDAVRKSLQLVDEADVYVLILGLRYGETPQGYDRSYTHLEYDHAVKRGIPIIALLSSDEHVFAQRDRPGRARRAVAAAAGSGARASHAVLLSRRPARAAPRLAARTSWSKLTKSFTRCSPTTASDDLSTRARR